MADPQKRAPGAMSADDVRAKLLEIINSSLGVDVSHVSDSSSIVDDLGADSLDVVELVMVIEKEFNITIPDEVAERMTTVGDAIDFITEALK